MSSLPGISQNSDHEAESSRPVVDTRRPPYASGEASRTSSVTCSEASPIGAPPRPNDTAQQRRPALGAASAAAPGSASRVTADQATLPYTAHRLNGHLGRHP